MIVRRALPSDVTELTRFPQQARLVFSSGGREDIARMTHMGTVSMGLEHDKLWGMVAIQLEARPETLPSSAPDRAYIRHLALARGWSPAAHGGQLIAHALGLLAGHVRPIEVVTYCTEHWLRTPLVELGFEEVECVQFMRLSSLQRRHLPPILTRNNIQIAGLEPGTLAALARLDAAAFPPRWHFSASELLPLIMAGHVHGAFHGATLVGYSALSIEPAAGALLERIAVAPEMRKRGIGRMLLVDALHRARDAGARHVTLNTQNHNHRAHSLYRAAGFRWTGYNVPIYSKYLAHTT